MAEQFEDRVDVLDGGSEVTITLNGNRAAVYVGDNGKTGSLRLRDGTNVERVILDAEGRLSIRDGNAEEIFGIDGSGGSLIYRDSEGRAILRFLSGRGALDLGATGKAGHLSIRDAEGKPVIEHAGEDATLRVGANGRAGLADFTDSRGVPTVQLDGDSATIKIGTEGNGGDLEVLGESGGLLFQVTASFARLRGALIVGARDAQGEIGIMDSMGRPAIHANGGTAKLQLGNIGNAGDFALLDNEAKPVLEADGLTATLAVGGAGKPGYVVLRDTDGAEVARLSGNEAALFLGRKEKAGEIMVLNNRGQSSFSVDGANGVVSVGIGETRVILDGSEGDIKLAGADCAEEFESVDAIAPESGTVLVIARESALGGCTEPYDTRVAGVVSGAGGARPGIILNQRGGENGRAPVALSGRVYCKVDADFAPIEIGDLLTTSATPGHAMKARDPKRAHGAVLGKALRRLDRGTGLIPVLVSLI